MTKRHTETTIESAVLDAWVTAEMLQEEITKVAGTHRSEILSKCLSDQLKAIHYTLNPEGGPA